MKNSFTEVIEEEETMISKDTMSADKLAERALLKEIVMGQL